MSRRTYRIIVVSLLLAFLAVGAGVGVIVEIQRQVLRDSGEDTLEEIEPGLFELVAIDTSGIDRGIELVRVLFVAVIASLIGPLFYRWPTASRRSHLVVVLTIGGLFLAWVVVALWTYQAIDNVQQEPESRRSTALSGSFDGLFTLDLQADLSESAYSVTSRFSGRTL